jgi:hypothetical protein
MLNRLPVEIGPTTARQAANCYKRRRTLHWLWDDVFRANVACGSFVGVVSAMSAVSPLYPYEPTSSVRPTTSERARSRLTQCGKRLCWNISWQRLFGCICIVTTLPCSLALPPALRVPLVRRESTPATGGAIVAWVHLRLARPSPFVVNLN